MFVADNYLLLVISLHFALSLLKRYHPMLELVFTYILKNNKYQSYDIPFWFEVHCSTRLRGFLSRVKSNE